VMLRRVQIRWTRTWAEKGGRARATAFSSEANFAEAKLSAQSARP